MQMWRQHDGAESQRGRHKSPNNTKKPNGGTGVGHGRVRNRGQGFGGRPGGRPEQVAPSFRLGKERGVPSRHRSSGGPTGASRGRQEFSGGQTEAPANLRVAAGRSLAKPSRPNDPGKTQNRVQSQNEKKLFLELPRDRIRRCFLLETLV
ncbi:hypothetical protein CRENBAI_021280 [Crenichthys baileyi]|uniref:Uncharacterized protein n=1 Tax=Crenichthys baileyi TaxID=28760 RepID=A0AAV9RQP5_9TELE